MTAPRDLVILLDKMIAAVPNDPPFRMTPAGVWATGVEVELAVRGRLVYLRNMLRYQPPETHWPVVGKLVDEHLREVMPDPEWRISPEWTRAVASLWADRPVGVVLEHGHVTPLNTQDKALLGVAADEAEAQGDREKDRHGDRTRHLGAALPARAAAHRVRPRVPGPVLWPLGVSRPDVLPAAVRMQRMIVAVLAAFALLLLDE